MGGHVRLLRPLLDAAGRVNVGLAMCLGQAVLTWRGPP